MEVKILSKEKIIFDGRAEAISLPTFDGEIEILDNHAPIFVLLKKGKLKIKEKKRIREVLIKSGILKFFSNKAVILLN
jgi:F0F1-type ATP synthase epsilon subunit